MEPCNICQRKAPESYQCECGSKFCSVCISHITSKTAVPRCPFCDSRLKLPSMDNERPSVSELKSTRVIQRTLIYVIGLAPSIASEALLKSEAYFGQYGRIKNIVVNTSNPYSSPSGISYSAYINFYTEISAVLCIKAISGFVLHERGMSGTFGTTKYCTHYINGQKCLKNNCFYLHELGSKVDTYSRKEISHQKHIQAHNSVFPILKVQVKPPTQGFALPHASPSRKYKMTPLKARKDSRFGFKYDDVGETQSQTPQYLEALVSANSARKMEAKILVEQACEIMKEPWAGDILRFEKENEEVLVRAYK